MSDQYWLNDNLGNGDDNDMSSFLNFNDHAQQQQQQQQQQQPSAPPSQQQQAPPTRQDAFNDMNSPLFNNQQNHHQASQEPGFSSHANSINPSAILNQARQDDPYNSGNTSNNNNNGNNNNLISEDPQTIMNFRNSNNASRTSNLSHFSPQVPQQQLQQSFNVNNNNTNTNNNNNNNENMNNENLNNSTLDKNAMMAALRQRQQQAQQQQLLQEQMKNMQAQQLLKQQMLQHAQQQQLQQQQQQQQQQQPALEDASSNNNSNGGAGMNQLQQQFYQQMQQQRMQQMQHQSNSQQPSNAGSPPPNSGLSSQPNSATQQQSPNPATTQIQQQQQQQAQQKRQRQLNQTLQLELFMKTLQDFARRKNIILPQNPVIDGRKIHLFFLYVLVSKMGGSNNVSRNNQWGFVASKFQLSVESNPNYAREVANFYHQYLYQFEQYASTQDGQREIYNIKLSIQKQMQQQFAQMQQQQQQQQQTSQSPAMQQQASPIRMSPIIPQQPQQHQSPLQMQQPPPPKKRRSTKGSKTSSPIVQQTPKPNSRKTSATSQAATPMSQQPLPQQLAMLSSAPTPAIIEEDQEQELQIDPNIPVVIRNYAPHQRLIELIGGYDISSLIQLSEHVDAGRPFYLFAPELGNIDLHALTMSLSSGISSEINNSLNTLLVTAADHHLMLQLSECPELLDSLCQVGLDVLDELILGKSDNVKTESIDSITKPQPLIDAVFEDYIRENNNNKNTKSDVFVKVDSFTGEIIVEDNNNSHETGTSIVEEDEEEEDSSPVNDLFSMEESTTPNESSPNSERKDVSAETVVFEIPSYTQLLLASREEIEQDSVKVFQKSAVNHQLMLVERLSTLSIILRNLSFIGNNNEMFSLNSMLKDYLFKLVNAIAMHPKKFLFARKKASLLKDSLIIFSGIADSLQLNNHKQALLIIALTLTFCGNVDSSVNDIERADSINDKELFIPCYSSKVQKYQPYAIDLFTKIVVRDPPNRELIKNVILGVYPSDSFPTDANNEVYQLTKLYLHGKDPRDGLLLSKTFAYLISVLPIYSIDKFIPILEERKIIVVQALLSCILLTEMFSAEDYKFNIALKWISSPELVASNLSKIGTALSVIKVNTNQELVLVSKRCLTLLNLLLERIIEFAKLNDKQGDDDDDDLKLLAKLPNIFPNIQLVCAATVSSYIDEGILKQLLKLSDLESELSKVLA